MPKKRTPTKRQKPRKTAPKPACWPAYAHEDVGYLWAREAIRMATPKYSRDTFGKRIKSIQEFVAN